MCGVFVGIRECQPGETTAAHKDEAATGGEVALASSLLDFGDYFVLAPETVTGFRLTGMGQELLDLVGATACVKEAGGQFFCVGVGRHDGLHFYHLTLGGWLVVWLCHIVVDSDYYN